MHLVRSDAADSEIVESVNRVANALRNGLLAYVDQRGLSHRIIRLGGEPFAAIIACLPHSKALVGWDDLRDATVATCVWCHAQAR